MESQPQNPEFRISPENCKGSIGYIPNIKHALPVLFYVFCFTTVLIYL